MLYQTMHLKVYALQPRLKHLKRLPTSSTGLAMCDIVQSGMKIDLSLIGQ